MKEVEFTVKVKMDESWANEFCSMLYWMQSCGEIGHSAITGFFADGDGDFRPTFDIDYEYEKVKAKWRLDQKLPELEVLFDKG